jgi:hypothetical protein
VTRPVSRVEVDSVGVLGPELLAEAAASQGVCVRPLLARVTDTLTGRKELVPIPCGSTRAAKCQTCAEKARRLRMTQCREGWHLEDEPISEPDGGDAEADEEQADQGEVDTRRVRSTRRRQDVADLPKVPMDARTVGATFRAKDGKTYRPSMFLTVTLGSYGRVRSDGTPADPNTYDYRRAALDALHFPKVIDRLMQNLRRCAGFKVQYFASIEPQRRLAPHLHAAIRGVLPRAVVKQVVAATYHQVWWPAIDEVVYNEGQLPVWADEIGYVDVHTGRVLPTWDEALDELDADPTAQPLHVVRLGKQLDMQGIIATSGQADRRIGYLTKYLAKSMADPMGDTGEMTPAQRRHVERLHAELRWLPCSPKCANWLRYGVQPAEASEGLVPGQCRSKAHDRNHLGCGGRRVLVSRKWTGKTLTDHRADRAEVVRQTLAAAGIEMPDRNRLAAANAGTAGGPRFEWSLVNPADTELPTYRDVISRAVIQARAWRAQYEEAKQRAGPPPPGDLSATDKAASAA